MSTTMTPEQIQRQRQIEQEKSMFDTMQEKDLAYSTLKMTSPLEAQAKADPVFKGRSYSSLSKDEKKEAKAEAHKPKLVSKAAMDSKQRKSERQLMYSPTNWGDI